MAIVNRDLAPSQQLWFFNSTLNLNVGASAAIGHHLAEMPFPGTLKAVALAARAISGSPVLSVGVKRFTSAGVTTIAFVGATLAPAAYGASAYSTQVFSVTSFALQTGDVVICNAAFEGGNVAADGSCVSVVVQATQDIKSYFGNAI